MGKRRKRRSNTKNSRISDTIEKKEIFFPWFVINVRVTYSNIRELNVFEWFFLKCLDEISIVDSDYTTSEVSQIIGLGQKGAQFLNPVISKLVINRSINQKDSDNLGHLNSYDITESGRDALLKGK